jgi:hypothetical protein
MQITKKIALAALDIAVNFFSSCPLEKCEYVVRDCHECKVNYCLDAARMREGEKG